MFFRKKVDRAFKYQKEQNQARYEGREEELEEFNKQGLPLEKGDGWAIFLSALIVFGPILLFFIIVLVLIVVLF